MMNRRQALEALKAHITDQIVIAAYSTASDWIEIFDRPLNYFSFGAMGLASSHGLGFALAHPGKRVVVLDGDGSLLMNLGTLVTIGRVAPTNFTHLLFNNGTYEANGGHPLPDPDTDFEALARAANIRSACTISELDDFRARLPGLLNGQGPVFAALMIEQGPLGPRDYKEMYRPARRKALREALGADNTERLVK